MKSSKEYWIYTKIAWGEIASLLSRRFTRRYWELINEVLRVRYNQNGEIERLSFDIETYFDLRQRLVDLLRSFRDDLIKELAIDNVIVKKSFLFGPVSEGIRNHINIEIGYVDTVVLQDLISRLLRSDYSKEIIYNIAYYVQELKSIEPFIEEGLVVMVPSVYDWRDDTQDTIRELSKIDLSNERTDLITNEDVSTTYMFFSALVGATRTSSVPVSSWVKSFDFFMGFIAKYILKAMELSYDLEDDDIRIFIEKNLKPLDYQRISMNVLKYFSKEAFPAFRDTAPELVMKNREHFDEYRNTFQSVVSESLKAKTLDEAKEIIESEIDELRKRLTALKNEVRRNQLRDLIINVKQVFQITSLRQIEGLNKIYEHLKNYFSLSEGVFLQSNTPTWFIIPQEQFKSRIKEITPVIKDCWHGKLDLINAAKKINSTPIQVKRLTLAYALKLFDAFL